MPPREQERSLLVKPVSGDCNLHCAYCFYHQRPGDLYREEGRHLMSLRVLESLIKQGMRLNRLQVTFGWQGGEPTLAGLDFFKKVVELEQKYGLSGQAVGNGLQTNGLLLDASWARFLRQYNFLVGVSLDGPAPYHDAYRTHLHGAPSHEHVVAALRLLAQYHVEFNILAVVNRLTAHHGAEIYDYFLSQGWRYIQFIPCAERDPTTGQLADFSVEPERFGDFLCAVFDRWYNDGHPQASVRDFEAILAAYLGQEAPMCSYQRECGSYLVVEYNGDVYPCDFMVDQRHYLGNLLETPLEALFAGEKLRRFAAIKAVPRPECRACPWLPYCHQGCPRFVGLDGPGHYLCRAYQRFFAHSHEGFMHLRERILRERGLAPAEALVPPGRAVKRNAPCPCRSGRKYKACCGRREART